MWATFAICSVSHVFLTSMIVQNNVLILHHWFMIGYCQADSICVVSSVVVVSHIPLGRNVQFWIFFVSDTSMPDALWSAQQTTFFFTSFFWNLRCSHLPVYQKYLCSCPCILLHDRPHPFDKSQCLQYFNWLCFLHLASSWSHVCYLFMRYLWQPRVFSQSISSLICLVSTSSTSPRVSITKLGRRKQVDFIVRSKTKRT